MNKKLKSFWILTAAALLICLAVATTAFLVRQTVTENIITFGSLRMGLEQTRLSADGEEIPVSSGESFNITNNDAVSRIIRIKNKGDHPMYVRIAVNMDGTDQTGKNFDAGKFVTYRIDEEDWIYKDSWYYYKKVLEPDETTENLMIQVTFDDIGLIAERYPGSRFEMRVDAQAVQSENNAKDVLSAVGWAE